MVFHNEAVYLDPALEDILSVWGKEVTDQNLDKFFGQVGNSASATFPAGGPWSSKSPKVSLEESLVLAGTFGKNGGHVGASGA